MTDRRPTRLAMHCVALCALLSMAMVGCAVGPGTVLHDDFRRAPYVTGWSPEARWAADDTGRLLVGPTPVHSRAIAVEAGRFYRLTFTARAEVRGYWAAHFYDATGRLLPDVYGNIEPAADPQRITTCIRAHALARTAELRFMTDADGWIAIDEVTLTSVSRAAVRRWADELYATLPAVRGDQSADRWRHIPDAMAKLRRGERLRVVIAGDSISNDIANSAFDLLIERQYPGARIELISVAASNAGAWWYVREQRIERLILPHEPELVIFSGISSSIYSAKHVDELVRRLRDGGVPEIVLSVDMSAVGRDEPNDNLRRYAKQINADTQGPAGRLYQVADAHGVGLLNTAGPVGDALARSDRPASYFMRDVVHYNDRGRQLLGRAFAAWFAPR